MAQPVRQLTDAERAAVRAYIVGGAAGDTATLNRGLARLRRVAFPADARVLTLAAGAGVTVPDDVARARGVAAVSAVRYALTHPYPDTVTAGVALALTAGPWIEARMVEVIADELRMAGDDHPQRGHWSRVLAWCDERLGREQLDAEDAVRGPRRRRQEVPA